MTNEQIIQKLKAFRDHGDVLLVPYLIEKDKLWKEMTEALDKAIEALSIDIVRCKDCKYWRDDHTCREHSLVSPMGANEFCSRGERGEQDDE